MNTNRTLRAAVAAPLLVAATLLLAACPTTRWLKPSATWEALGREHNTSSLAWAEEPDAARSWPRGIVGLYMIEGYVREWPADAPAPYREDGRYLAVMTLQHDDARAAAVMNAAAAECRRFDTARQIPAPFPVTRGGDLNSYVYLCASADLAAALGQAEERERAEEYLHAAGFRFEPDRSRAP